MLRNKLSPCPYINPKLFYDIVKLPQDKEKKEKENFALKYIPKVKNVNVKTNSRNSIITSRCVGHGFIITTGKLSFRILVSKNIVGSKFGEFSYTRKKYYYKNKKRRKRKNA
jgi:ribosomal protein S19